jgi:hypothetical protein
VASKLSQLAFRARAYRFGKSISTCWYPESTYVAITILSDGKPTHQTFEVQTYGLDTFLGPDKQSNRNTGPEQEAGIAESDLPRLKLSSMRCNHDANVEE